MRVQAYLIQADDKTFPLYLNGFQEKKQHNDSAIYRAQRPRQKTDGLLVVKMVVLTS